MSISAQAYAIRRQQVMDKLGPDAVAIIEAAPVRMRTESAEYPYRQDNNFYYLTGFPEPDAVLVLVDGQSILFCKEKDRAKEIWHGNIIGPEKAVSDFGLDKAFPFKEFEIKIKELSQGKTVHRIEEPKKENMLCQVLAELRLFKSDDEIALMRKAAEISAKAHCEAMKAVYPGMTEYQLAAVYEFVFKNEGGSGIAYESIVGGGKNACILHYRENNEVLKEGELVLVDAATEYEGYAADITRTFPVNGKFTPEQKAVYEVVLHAQKAGVAAIKPGVTWEAVQEQVVRDITSGLIDLGLLSGDVDKLIEDKAYQKFYMHSAGHWIGLDVHDVGEYKRDDVSRPLQPNMVMTMEPGIYISPSEDVDPRWHNIGVRIEDDVLVTASGNDVLSKDVPKEIDEIEALMASSDEQTTRIKRTR